ncbi:hypothetical protein [Actinomadura welshii]|uniref:hypothetical protein n=1 Tax=Actinomadura welshii TaxID=3103817 RepID=UPI0003AD44DA|nr:hypothetical protein [Actinomadura madurae]
MSPRTSPNRPGPATARPGPARNTARPAARLAGRLWANRPSLGTLACLLAIPGVANVVFGWPLWQVAAGQWSLWLLLLAVSTAEARDTRPLPAEPSTAAEPAPAGETAPHSEEVR